MPRTSQTKNVAKQAAIANNMAIIAWRAASKICHFLQPGVPFATLPKRGTPEHAKVKECQKQLIAKWTETGIPAEYKPAPRPEVPPASSDGASEVKQVKARKPRAPRAKQPEAPAPASGSVVPVPAVETKTESTSAAAETKPKKPRAPRKKAAPAAAPTEEAGADVKMEEQKQPASIPAVSAISAPVVVVKLEEEKQSSAPASAPVIPAAVDAAPVSAPVVVTEKSKRKPKARKEPEPVSEAHVVSIPPLEPAPTAPVSVEVESTPSVDQLAPPSPVATQTSKRRKVAKDDISSPSLTSTPTQFPAPVPIIASSASTSAASAQSAVAPSLTRSTRPVQNTNGINMDLESLAAILRTQKH